MKTIVKELKLIAKNIVGFKLKKGIKLWIIKTCQEKHNNRDDEFDNYVLLDDIVLEIIKKHFPQDVKIISDMLFELDLWDEFKGE